MTTETFTLSRPLKTHNGEVQTLTLKEPFCRAFIPHGDPFKLVPRYNAAGEQDGVTFVYDNNRAMLSVLSEMIEPRLDDLILESIGSSDYMRLRVIATNIILSGVPAKNPTEPSSA